MYCSPLSELERRVAGRVPCGNLLFSVSRWEVPYKDITLSSSASSVPASGTYVLVVLKTIS